MITIEKNVIKALLTIAAKNDTRHYLNGVLLDVRASDAVLVATDGHALLAVPVANDGETPPGQYIVGRDVLEVVKGKTVAVSIDAGQTVTVNGVTTALIDEKYPDWRGVIPGSCSGEVAQFDPLLIGRCGRALELLGVKFSQFHHNGKSPARFSSVEWDGVLIVMSWRFENEDAPPMPAWAKK